MHVAVKTPTLCLIAIYTIISYHVSILLSYKSLCHVINFLYYVHVSIYYTQCTTFFKKSLFFFKTLNYNM